MIKAQARTCPETVVTTAASLGQGLKLRDEENEVYSGTVEERSLQGVKTWQHGLREPQPVGEAGVFIEVEAPRE